MRSAASAAASQAPSRAWNHRHDIVRGLWGRSNDAAAGSEHVDVWYCRASEMKIAFADRRSKLWLETALTRLRLQRSKFTGFNTTVEGELFGGGCNTQLTI
jgi:hypothetical protein